ncbi:NACHT domain-containing protein [Rhizobium laguerreae]
MSLPDIDFHKIRLHRGNPSTAFEELCCQLAGDEPIPDRAAFERKGPGGDGGVECFAIREDGSETGWQVKYYFNFQSMLSSLDKSLTKALDKHPRMTRFNACFPIDLSDVRREDVKTALASWSQWRDRRVKEANDAGREVSIERWDAYEIKNRLTESNAKSAGRIAFWFDQEMFDTNWFSKKFDRAKSILKQRYSPETHVDLPIRRSILAITRDPIFLDELSGVSKAISGQLAALSSRDSTDAITATENLVAAFEVASRARAEDLNIGALRKASEDTESALLSWHKLRYQTEGAEAARPISNLVAIVGSAAAEIGNPCWEHLQAKRLLVVGDAGRGKSHLLADACAHQLKSGRPALLIPSGSLAAGDPWQQILRFLDLPPHMRVAEFLGALNAAGEACGIRTLLAIDALNEKNGQAIWSGSLAGLLHDLNDFPFIGIVLSCRSTYERPIIGDDFSETELPKVEHLGFTADEAAQYIDQRGTGIVNTPNALDELSIPLFAKIYCDAIEDRISTDTTKAPQGISELFRVYREAAAVKIDRSIGIDSRRKVVQKAIDILAAEMAITGRSEVDWNRTHELLAAIHSSPRQEDDLLFQLENEGILTADCDDEGAEFMRFTFERFGDHAIAQHLLDSSWDNSSPTKFCGNGSPFWNFLEGPFSYLGLGVQEAMAVLLPEQKSFELPDIVEEDVFFSSEAFEKSLVDRKISAFTNRTWELIESLGDDELQLETLIALATEPNHPRNCDYLDGHLRELSMPERDGTWSVHVASSKRARKFVDWSLRENLPISDERARLSICLLSWFLTTSSRALRDKATKALVNLLGDRPDFALFAWRHFWGVDDPYVIERVAAAICGAAMQGRWSENCLADIATAVFSDLFAEGQMPANILLRDHGRGIVKFAAHRTPLPGLDISLLDQPGDTAWPLEIVSEATIASYKRRYDDGAEYSDEIVGSCFGGDFGRYKIDMVVSRWSALPRGTKMLGTAQELRDRWFADFQSYATPKMISAYDAVLAASELGENQMLYDSRTKEGIGAAKDAFRQAVGDERYGEWESKAEHWRKGAIFQAIASRGPAQFNLASARRWVCMRAHTYGWSQELHGDFDRRQGSGRMSHTNERIGKKYQWLAFYELLARLEDHIQPLPSQTTNENEPTDQRNLDPSILISKTSDNGWRSFEKGAFWVPTAPNLIAGDPDSAVAWLNSAEDILDGQENIEVTDPETGIEWLVLRGFESWRAERPTFHLDSWRRIGCFFVQRRDRKKALERIAPHQMTDSHAIPLVEMPYREHLGEYPWARERLGDDWISGWTPGFSYDAEEKKLSVRPAVAEYTAESNGYDASIEENLTIHLPAPWLMKEMGVRLSNGKSLTYVDGTGQTIFMDPSINKTGRSAALVRRDTLSEMVERLKLTPIWVVAGEKGIYGPETSTEFGGRMTYTRAFTLQKKKIVGENRVEVYENFAAGHEDSDEVIAEVEGALDRLMEDMLAAGEASDRDDDR